MPDPNQNENYFPQPLRGVFTLRDLFYVLFRHKWKMTLFFVTVMIAVIIGVLIAKEIYRSEAKLMIKIGRESVSLDPTAATGQVISVGPSRESEINSEIEILKSQELAIKVVDAIGPAVMLERGQTKSNLEISSPGGKRLQEFRNQLRLGIGRIKEYFANLGLLHPLAEREEGIILFSKSFTVERLKNTNILALSYDGPDATLSQNILSKVIDVFLEKHIAAHRTSGSYEFFGRQSDQIRNQVGRVEEELKNLKSQTGVSSLEEQKRILITRVGSLQQESENTQSGLAISRARIQNLREKLATMSPTLVTQEVRGTANQGADLMRSRLYELQLKELELLSKYTPQSRPVQEVRKQIEDAQALLAKEEPTRTQVTTGTNPAYQELNLDLIKEMTNFSSLEAKANVLKGQQEAARSKLAELNNTEVKMVNLQREQALLDGKYRKYTENLEQARIDQALMNNKISNIGVIQAATASLEPVKPLKALYIALGFLLGILGAIFLAFLSEYHDHSLKKPQDVEEKLNLPLLASIPVLRK
jgi:polysaccharide biosynthesis protein PslE